eukprot:1177516-Prorocentrum_minimum.AAC.2
MDVGCGGWVWMLCEGVSCEGVACSVRYLGVGVADAGEDGALHGGAVRHRLVGVHALAELLALEEVLQNLLHARHAGGAAHQHNLVHTLLGALGVLQHRLHRVHAPLEVRLAQLLKLGARQLHLHLLLANRALDLRGHGGGQLALGRLAGGADLALVAGGHGGVVLRGPLILAAQLRVHPVRHRRVKVLASQVGVASGGEHLEEAAVELEEGYIEGAAAEIEDEHRLRLALRLVQTVGQRRRRRLVDDAHHLQARNRARVLQRAQTNKQTNE